MCGILGVYNLNNKRVDKSLCKSMLNKINHRGPDGFGDFYLDNIALLHRRLAILDTTNRGNQPMFSKNNKWVIVFNGCIYNYLDLKNDLISKGHYFNSNSDTEVIVEGIEEYGIDFIKSLNGMFSIAVLNVYTKDLYLIRDRYGIKPLYYWFNGKTLVFSSEIKSIIAHKDFSMDVDHDSLDEYFTFQNMLSFKTLFKGIHLLPPANILHINSLTKKITHNSWWDYDFTNADYSMSFEEVSYTLSGLIKQAIERQLVSDVPLGSYLSGGVDSGTIASVASNKISGLHTFTCGFDMSNITGVEVNYDERKQAELISAHLKSRQYERIINSTDIRFSIDKIVYSLEDLRLGMSYPNYYASNLASKFVKVCLQGAGGDELFGGYPWRYYRIFDSINAETFYNKYYSFWQRLVKDEEKHLLFNNQLNKSIDISESRKKFCRVFTFNQKLKYNTPQDYVNNSLYFEAKTFLSSLFLVGDKLSMANGLEERFPFMDNDLVDFAMRIPIEYKLGNLEKEIIKIDENQPQKRDFYKNYDDGKNILRDSMKNFLPNEIINNKKQGFSAPEENWFRKDNFDFTKNILLNKKSIMREFIDLSFVDNKLNNHLNKKENNRLLLWSFLCFDRWCNIFLDGKTPN